MPQSNSVLLKKINKILFPFKLATYGENFSSKNFGVQNSEGTYLFIGNSFPWTTWSEAGIGAYFYETKPEDLPKDQAAQNIVDMAIKFKKYLDLSPVIWVKETIETCYKNKPFTKKRAPETTTRCYGTQFFKETLTKHIAANPEHTRITTRPLGKEEWFVNGNPINQWGTIELKEGSTVEVRVTEVTKNDTTTYNYQISL